jgi:hypothetical protein
MRAGLVFSAVLLLGSIVGCRDFPISSGAIPCSKTGKCPSPLVCSADRCVARDAGTDRASGAAGKSGAEGGAGASGDGGVDLPLGADADVATDGTPDTGEPPPACPENQHLCPVGCVANESPQTCATSCSPCQAPANGGTATCNGMKCDGTCPSGKKLCLGACIDAASACGSTCPADTHLCGQSCPSTLDINACGTSCAPCPVPANAVSATCDGKACSFTCKTGFHACGSTGTSLCVGSAAPACCSSSECTAGPAGTVGVCSNHVCTYPCNTPAYKACNGACIPSAGCCTSADCAGVCSTCSNNACVAVKSADDADSCAGTCDASGACKSKQGQTCQTTSGGCVGGTSCAPDGVCCNQACTASCLACDLPGFVGVCMAVNSGAPRGNRVTCVSGSCGGACAGRADGACQYPSGTQCGSPTCSGTSLVDYGTCGSGTCTPPSARACNGGYVCSANACKTMCSSSSDCQSGYYCSGTSCSPKKSDGQVCGAVGECLSGVCGGKCCAKNTSCTCPQPSGQNLVKNSGLDADVTNWNGTADGYWSSDDPNGCPYSGSLKLTTYTFTNENALVWQCINLSAAQMYNFGATMRNGDPAIGGTGTLCENVECELEWFSGANCTGNNLPATGSAPIVTWSNAVWSPSGSSGTGGTPFTPPAATTSAKISCFTGKQYDQSQPPGYCVANFDKIFLTPNPGAY